MLQGLEFRRDIGGHLELVGQEPHHDDTQNPPDNLPDPDRRHPVDPFSRLQGATENRVADHAAGSDGEKEPDQGEDPAPFNQVLFFR